MICLQRRACRGIARQVDQRQVARCGHDRLRGLRRSVGGPFQWVAQCPVPLVPCPARAVTGDEPAASGSRPKRPPRWVISVSRALTGPKALRRSPVATSIDWQPIAGQLGHDRFEAVAVHNAGGNVAPCA